MKILALETSTERLSLALADGARMTVRDIDAGQRHSELALAALRELLAESGVAIAELDAIAFGQGPGSFVGVRIACGLAQGLALGAGKLLAPVPTLMALAEQAGGDKVLVANDARMGEFYFAAYRRDGAVGSGWRAEVEPMLATRDSLPTIEGDGWQAIGSAFHVEPMAATMRARYAGRFASTVAATFPSAADVARVAARMILQGGPSALIAPEQAAPLYLRNKVALTIAERAQQRASATAGAVA